MQFIFFTKTRWDEPSRIRHQLAHLLAKAGHDVIFFTKPRYPWIKKSLIKSSVSGIHLFEHQELIHHKLRVFSWLRNANAYWTKRSIRKKMQELNYDNEYIIVNFNYEYYFLHNLFPSNKLICIINDDFISNALFGYKKPLFNALKLTCQSSDCVLTLSTPLLDQVRGFCSPYLFLPWTDCSYKTPMTKSNRNILLFWGYINKRIDFEFVAQIADILYHFDPTVKLLFIGPSENADQQVNFLRTKSNIEFYSPISLDKLPFQQILAGFIPYRNNDYTVDAIMMPNKALQLLARGLPLMITGMPHFVNEPFVFRIDENSIQKTILYIRNHFDDLQPSIRDFVSKNESNARLEQFMDYINVVANLDNRNLI